MEEHLGAAQRKDAGLTPGQLAWVLAEIDIGDDAAVPGGVTAGELRDYLKDLTSRLAQQRLPWLAKNARRTTSEAAYPQSPTAA